MKWKCLVTGGAGFIGSHLTDELIKNGHKVVVVDNLSSGRKENLNKKAKFYKADIIDFKIESIFRKEKPNYVFHYAAQIKVSESLKYPDKDAKVNILGSLNILKNCKRFKVKKFIFASSVGVYGEPKVLPIKESAELNPISPYAIGKLAIENYLRFFKEEGLDSTILRYANVYGPRQSSAGEGGVVAIFIDNLLKGKKIVIFGNGKQTRDFLYVKDAVKAAILAMNGPDNIVCNIGINKSIIIKDLLKLIANISGKKDDYKLAPIRKGEIINSRVDAKKAQKIINWKPEYSLEKGLKITLGWFEKIL